MNEPEDLESRIKKTLDKAIEEKLNKDRMVALKLMNTRRNNFGIMLGLCAIFLLGVSILLWQRNLNNAVVFLIFSIVTLLIAAWHTDRLGRSLRELAKKFRHQND